MFIYSILPNGLRMVIRQLPHTPAEMCGLAIDAGSRDETAEEHGLAHFVEHTLFKGTLRRRAHHINNRMEAVGGELNAYTTKEETFLYSTFPAGQGHLDRAAELIADLVMNSQFPPAELDTEREVVMDEIMSYLDTPAERVFDDFDDMIYAGSALGHNILGTVESVRRLDTAMCRNWLGRHYTPGKMVFFYTGPLEAEEVERIALRRFGRLHHADTPRERTIPAEVERFATERNVGSHQAHSVSGTRIGGLNSDDRTAMALAVNILGGPGMNSLLNIELREKRGLVYSIEASTALLTDTGTFTVYFGCDPEDLKRCRRIAGDTLNRFSSTELTPRRLEAAKRQMLGQILVGGANQENVILAAARSTLHCGAAPEPEQTAARIAAITPAALREAAGRLCTDHLSTLTLR